MSQSELARQVSITQGTVAGLLSGKSRSSTHLHVIARALLTTPEFLTGETDDPDLNAPREPMLSDDLRALVGFYELLDSSDQAALLQLARSIAGGRHRRKDR